MRNMRKYIDMAKNGAVKSYANADGQFDVAPSNTENAFANFSGMGGYRNAAGAGAMQPTSQPYVINVTSTSGAAVSNFEILGSDTYLYGATGTWANGSLTIGSITISSGTPNITYQQMLAQFQNKPFLNGLTYYQSSTANQIQQSISVVVKDATGNTQTMPITSNVDPYQFQSTVIALPNTFTVDGNTSLVIASVLANATITLKLFPADKIDVTAGLVGNQISRSYANPGIVKAQPVVVQ